MNIVIHVKRNYIWLKEKQNINELAWLCIDNSDEAYLDVHSNSPGKCYVLKLPGWTFKKLAPRQPGFLCNPTWWETVEGPVLYRYRRILIALTSWLLFLLAGLTLISFTLTETWGPRGTVWQPRKTRHKNGNSICSSEISKSGSENGPIALTTWVLKKIIWKEAKERDHLRRKVKGEDKMLKAKVTT